MQAECRAELAAELAQRTKMDTSLASLQVCVQGCEEPSLSQRVHDLGPAQLRASHAAAGVVLAQRAVACMCVWPRCSARSLPSLSSLLHSWLRRWAAQAEQLELQAAIASEEQEVAALQAQV